MLKDFYLGNFYLPSYRSSLSWTVCCEPWCATIQKQGNELVCNKRLAEKFEEYYKIKNKKYVPRAPSWVSLLALHKILLPIVDRRASSQSTSLNKTDRLVCKLYRTSNWKRSFDTILLYEIPALSSLNPIW